MHMVHPVSLSFCSNDKYSVQSAHHTISLGSLCALTEPAFTARQRDYFFLRQLILPPLYTSQLRGLCAKLGGPLIRSGQSSVCVSSLVSLAFSCVCAAFGKLEPKRPTEMFSCVCMGCLHHLWLFDGESLYIVEYCRTDCQAGPCVSQVLHSMKNEKPPRALASPVSWVTAELFLVQITLSPKAVLGSCVHCNCLPNCVINTWALRRRENEPTGDCFVFITWPPNVKHGVRECAISRAQ